MSRVGHKGVGIEDADTIECVREIVWGQPLVRYELIFP
jgi:hypothetical protein